MPDYSSSELYSLMAGLEMGRRLFGAGEGGLSLSHHSLQLLSKT
jgi:hypothetical protein